MKKVKRWLRRWWWTILLGAALLGAAALWILLPRRRNGKTPPPGEPPVRTFVEVARTEIERVKLEGEVEKARITATADAQREQIDRIEEVGATDPVEGRRQLAAFLNGVL